MPYLGLVDEARCTLSLINRLVSDLRRCLAVAATRFLGRLRCPARRRSVLPRLPPLHPSRSPSIFLGSPLAGPDWFLSLPSPFFPHRRASLQPVPTTDPPLHSHIITRLPPCRTTQDRVLRRAVEVASPYVPVFWSSTIRARIRAASRRRRNKLRICTSLTTVADLFQALVEVQRLTGFSSPPFAALCLLRTRLIYRSRDKVIIRIHPILPCRPLRAPVLLRSSRHRLQAHPGRVLLR